MTAATEYAICPSPSHLELYTRDAGAMEEFYTGYPGCVVTDRGRGQDGMVFLSRNPRAHHQPVLDPAAERPPGNPVDHVSSRVETPADHKTLHRALPTVPAALQAASHGNTWPICFLDPDGNRLELFADTPWHVDQSCRFEIDLPLAEDELIEYTENAIRALPGILPAKAWRRDHARDVGRDRV